MKKLILLLILISLASCGTKQKALQKEKEKTELSVESETKTEETEVINEEETTVKTTDSTSEKNEITVTDIKEKDLDIEADEGGEVTVIEEKTETGTKTTFKGVKNLSIRDRVENIRNELTERINVLKQDSINRVRNDSIARIKWAKEKLALEKEIKKKNQEKEIDNRNMFWFWGFWILIVLIIIYIIYKNKKHMKPFIILLLLLAFQNANAQGIKFTFTQDAKLATMKDDHGNTPWTWNTTTKVHFQEFDFGEKYGYPTVGVKFEYADLDSGSFYRYGVEAGYCIPFYNVRSNNFGQRPLFHITPLLGYGEGKRSFTSAYQSFEGSIETGVNITERFTVVALHNYTQREGFWRYSFHLGLQYKI